MAAKRTSCGTCRRCGDPYGGTVAGRLVVEAWAETEPGPRLTVTDRPPALWFPGCGECFLCWQEPPEAWDEFAGGELPF